MKAIYLGAALLLLASPALMAQTIHDFDNPIPEQRTFLRDSEEYEGLKAGPGREETYYAFKGCYKIGWIKRQTLTRTQWDMAVDKMAQECNLEPFAPDDKQVIVDYLVAAYGRGR
jgi:cytochrome c